MELTPKQQALERIKSAEKILLLTHTQPDGDALGSLLALTDALKKLNKKVTAVVDPSYSPTFKFMPGIEALQTSLQARGDFVISVDISNTGLQKLGYKRDESNHRVMIVVTPAHGALAAENVSFESSGYDVDLIVTLDCNSIDRLGAFYNQHTTLFYETPLVNIDHHPDNEHFGAVNWVDVTATSTSEILVSLLEALGRETQLIDADVATNLLTGITTDTASFKNQNTTPKSLTVAAQLVAAGARQQEIVHHLYKVKPIWTLKLWGKALANIQERPDMRVLWAKLSKQDFVDAGADAAETKGLVDELLKTAQGVAFVFLLTEKEDGIHVSFRSVEKGIPVSEIAKALGGGGHEAAAGAVVDDSLSVAEDKVLQEVAVFWERRKTA